MFCTNCGREISADVDFCVFCGTKKSLNATSNRKKAVFCPRCGSKELTSAVENDTQGGGYNFATGCLCGLIIGIPGLFCGEREVKTTIRTNFICMECSNKFREANEWAEEKSKKSTSRIIWTIILVFFGLYYISVDEGMFGIILLGVGACLGYSGYVLKVESNDITSNKYNSRCYKE